MAATLDYSALGQHVQPEQRKEHYLVISTPSSEVPCTRWRRCHKRWKCQDCCDYLGQQEAKTQLERLATYACSGRWLVSLTPPPLPSLRDSVELLLSAWKAVTRQITYARVGRMIQGALCDSLLDILGGFASVHPKRTVGGWHSHIHAIIASPSVPDILGAWQRVTYTPAHVHVEPVKPTWLDIKKAATYCVCFDLPPSIDDQLELKRVLERKKLIRSFGVNF